MKRYAFGELSNDEQYHVLLKLATRKYDVDRHSVIIKIGLNTPKEVIISESDRAMCLECLSSIGERVCNIIEAKLILNRDRKLIEIFDEYKKNGGKKGGLLEEQLYFKYYHGEEPKEMERTDRGRKWIDFNKQLSKEDYIVDIENGCGLWAMIPNYLYKAIGVTDRYGENIMVLSPISDLEYIVTDREIVGDKFKVKMFGSLHEEQTWEELSELLGEDIYKSMPLEARKKFDGADNAYRKYVNRNLLMQKSDEDEVLFDKKKTMIEKLKLLIRQFNN